MIAKLINFDNATYLGTFDQNDDIIGNSSENVPKFIFDWAQRCGPQIDLIANVGFFFIEPLVSTEKYPKIPLSNSSCMP